MDKKAGKREVTDHKGNKYNNVVEMCRAYNISKITYYKRVKNGWSMGKALETPVRRWNSIPSVDHLGQEFENTKSMCEHWEIAVNTYYKYLSEGYSIEEILTGKARKQRKRKLYDHLGNRYETVKDMCKQWRISDSYYFRGRSEGRSLEDILTKRKQDRVKESIPEIVTDHKGNKFSSLKSMLDFYNVGEMQYYIRKAKGWDLEDILFLPRLTSYKNGDGVIVDHEGNVYSSLKAMCTYYNITIILLNTRLGIGWSLEKALTTDKNIIMDHLGNRYNSISEMCKTYGINRTCYETRIRNGWSVKKALLCNRNMVKDHLGKEFKNVNSMCEYYGIINKTFKDRIRRGWSLEDSLTIKPDKSNKCINRQG